MRTKASAIDSVEKEQLDALIDAAQSSSPSASSAKRNALSDDELPMLARAASSPSSSMGSCTNSPDRRRSSSNSSSNNSTIDDLVAEHVVSFALLPNAPALPCPPLSSGEHDDMADVSFPKLSRHPVASEAEKIQYRRYDEDDGDDVSVYFSLSDNEVDESSSFACLRKFSGSTISSAESYSSSSSFPSSSSDSSDSLMSDSSSDRSALIGSDSSVLALSSIKSTNNSSNASAAWSRRRERMNKKKKALLLDNFTENSKARRKFLKNLAKRRNYSNLYINYLKGNEKASHAHVINSDVHPEGIINKVRRCVLFEIFHSVPAATTKLLFCITHVAIYEFFQMFLQDFLELNEYENQFLVYLGVLFVALLMARACGRLWEWVGDDTYDAIKFDMRNKSILGDLDVYALRWFKQHPRVRSVVDVSSIYLCYLAANHLITETMLKSFFDVSEEVLEDLPSAKYPDISTQIKSTVAHGERMFEDTDLVTAADGSAASSTACTILGGDLCDERVFQACNKLDAFRAKLSVDDGVFLYDEVSFDTYYKVIGDVSAGIYYYESVMIALFCVFLAGAMYLKRVGVGFWDR